MTMAMMMMMPYLVGEQEEVGVREQRADDGDAEAVGEGELLSRLAHLRQCRMSRHVTSRHTMPCHAMPCHVMPCHTIPCHAMSRHGMECSPPTPAPLSRLAPPSAFCIIVAIADEIRNLR